MLDEATIRATVERVSYRDWVIEVRKIGERFALQTKSPESPVYGRLWLIEDRHDESDIVRACFAAITMVEEHERREFFMVDDNPVWFPHDPVIS